MSDDGEFGMWWAGVAAATYNIAAGKYTVKVQARGQQGCGIWPVLRLYVDGVEKGAQEVASAEIGTYAFAQIVFAENGEHSIGIEFVQPDGCSEPGQDVNLFIRGVFLTD